MTRVVIIGGVAAGMSAASQAKRRDSSLEVIALERGPHVSYGACGMPYNIGDPARPIHDLVVITPEQFRHTRGIDVRVRHEVLAIDAAGATLRVRDLEAARDDDLPYDRLVIATGATAVRPPVPGLDLAGVFVLRELTDGAALKDYLERQSPQRAVIIGAGYVGLEMAEALVARGLSVTLVERAAQVAPGLEPVIADLVQEELVRHGVQVVLGATVNAVERSVDGLMVRTQTQVLFADLVLVAVGVRPNVALARAAGLTLGASGAIAVDAAQRTNLPGIYAAGDCAEAHHRVLQAAVYIPLGTTANKQGKVAGANAAGGEERFGGIVGTAGFRVFDLEVARTGIGGSDIERHGLDVVSSVSRHNNRGRHYPGAARLTTVLFTERASGRLLGAQMAGADGVALRVDVYATALHAGLAVDEIEALDLAYAPPFAPVYDPVLVAATVARKAVTRKD
jgi:NADPH-dependent 2,4-dienoyl-CoA reductase/sulfur reductase-like enzyme